MLYIWKNAVEEFDQINPKMEYYNILQISQFTPNLNIFLPALKCDMVSHFTVV